jgi:hypothetical protein
MNAVSNVEMSFGRYVGCKLHDVPTDYLEWVENKCDNISTTLRLAIDAELRRRETELATAKAASAKRAGECQ